MLLRNNSSVNDGEFSNFMTFDNGGLSNVRPVLGGFSRGTGMVSGLKSIWNHKRAYVPRGKISLPPKGRPWVR